MRLLVPSALGLILFLVWVYAIFDIVATESMLVRSLPKITWLFLVILVPGVGAVAWLALGRPLNAGWYPGDTAVRPRKRVVGPEDRDDWSPPARPRPPHRLESTNRSAAAHPANDGPTPRAEAAGDPADPRESPAARERRLMEWEAELARREADLDGDA